MNHRTSLGAVLLLSSMLAARAADPIPDPPASPGPPAAQPPTDQATPPTPASPKQAPEFPTFTDPVKAKDLRGKAAPEVLVDEWITPEPDTLNKVVIISFWATWCPHCRRSLGRLEKIHERYPDSIAVIAVCQDDPVKTRDFIKEHPLDIGVASDLSRRTIDAVAPGNIPHCIVVSPDGIVRWQGITNRLTTGVLDQILKASGIEPPPSSAQPSIPDPAPADKKQPETSAPAGQGPR